MKSKIVATFKGYGSLGYERDKTYFLWTWIQDNMIYISRIDGSGQCPYKNIKLFEQNWKVHGKAKSWVNTK